MPGYEHRATLFNQFLMPVYKKNMEMYRKTELAGIAAHDDMVMCLAFTSDKYGVTIYCASLRLQLHLDLHGVAAAETMCNANLDQQCRQVCS